MKDIVKKVYLEHNESLDERVMRGVLENFESGDDISIGLIQRFCRCGYFSASRVLEELISNNKVQRGKTLTAVCKFL